MDPPLFDPHYSPRDPNSAPCDPYLQAKSSTRSETRKRPKTGTATYKVRYSQEADGHGQIFKPSPPRSPRPKSAKISPRILQELLPYQALLVSRYLQNGTAASYMPPPPVPAGEKEVLYKLVVQTGNTKGGGTDARVFVTLHGDRGRIPRRQLSKSPYRGMVASRFRFQTGSTDTFRFRTTDIGDITSLTIQHDGKTRADGWFLERIYILKTDLGTDTEQIWTFPCHSWLSLHEPNSEISRELFPRLGASTVYEIDVETGRLDGAGSDAAVYITLFGTSGRSPKFQLTSTGELRQVFIRGSTERFQQKTVSVGHLTKIKVQHNNEGIDPSWYLEKVTIRDTGKPDWIYTFLCRKWLAGDSCSTYIPLAQEPLARDTQRYKVITKTGDVKHAGTDAMVHVELFGSNGNHAKRGLRNKNGHFKRGCSNEFVFECFPMGDIEKIRVYHDNTGFAPAWFLEDIKIIDLVTQKVYDFPCHQWLARTLGDGNISRELEWDDPSQPKIPIVNYTVNIITGNKRHSGTDANVHLQMYGKDRWSEETHLNTKGAFFTGRKDVFTLECPALGELEYIQIRLDNCGRRPSWYLNRIIIKDTDLDTEYTFTCNSWLSFETGEYHLLKRLYPDPSRSPTPESSEPETEPEVPHEYKLTVYTGNDINASTEAGVKFELFGKDGLSLCHNVDGGFETGSERVFTLENPESLGDIDMIRVSHNNGGFNPSWQLNKIIVKDITAGTVWEFHCRRWLARDMDDGQISREIRPGPYVEPPEPQPEPEPEVTLNIYMLEVSTGEYMFSGTDARIYVKMIGDKAESMELLLDTSRGQLEVGSTDTIELLSPEDLGAVSCLKIRHDNSGLSPGWFLNSITVYRKDNPDVKYTFVCYRWLAEDEDDGAISRVLYSDSVVRSYKISVYTGDRANAGSDANVYIELFGDISSSGKRILTQPGKNCFERSNIDSFTISCTNLGKLVKVKVGHDNTGAAPGYFLDKIIVDDIDSGDTYGFPCFRWLDKSEDDGANERELFLQKVVAYKVMTQTGSKLGAGSDANIYLELHGEAGATGAMQLYLPGRNCFEAGKKDSFKVECSDVGAIQKVRVFHDNSGAAPGWYLNKVVVKDTTRGLKTTFPCYKWLARDEDDGAISRELLPEGTVVASEYRVIVYTGNRRGAGTDANVFIKLIGENGESTEKELDKTMENNFEKGKKDEFTIECVNLGSLIGINCRHDNSGMAPGWFLDKIVVLDVKRNTTVEFPCYRWFSTDEDDGKITRELKPRTEKVGHYKVTVETGTVSGAGTDSNVYLEIFGSKNNSGERHLDTDENNFESGSHDVFKVDCLYLGDIQSVRIWHDNAGMCAGWYLSSIRIEDTSTKRIYLFECNRWLARNEDDGQTSRILDNPKILAESGSEIPSDEQVKDFMSPRESPTPRTDDSDGVKEFEVHAHSTIKRFEIQNETETSDTDVMTSEPSSDEDKSVSEADSSSTDSGTEASDDVDGRVNKTSHSSASHVHRTQTSPTVLGSKRATQQNCSYRVAVYTGVESHAGTDATVSISLYGDENKAENIVLDRNANIFRKGTKDEFTFQCPRLGPVQRLVVRHDNTGVSPSWFLDRIVVDDLDREMTYSFSCYRWLAVDEDDCKIERELLVDAGTASGRTWLVQTYTSSLPLAGTNSDIWMVLYSLNNENKTIRSDDIKIKNQGKNLEQGAVDKFAIELEDIGKPYKLRVGHDNKGVCPGWHLDRIEITHVVSRRRYKFRCGRWLAKDEDDGAICREMPAEGLDIKKPKKLLMYKVQVFTGDKMCAGTDANVFINIVGEQGDTGKRYLAKSTTNANKFERGQMDEFYIEAVNLKALKKVIVGHDSSSAGSGWFLDRIIVSRADSGKNAATFHCNRWFDVNEDDGMIVRELTAGINRPMLSTTTYHVHIKTGDVFGAGTDANVYLALHGENGDTGRRELHQAENHRNKFERGRVDLFYIEASDIGKLTRMVLGHDDSNPGSAWFVDEVTVEVPTAATSYLFTVNRWLDSALDGCEVSVGPSDVGRTVKKIPYSVTVWTADVQYAGTDANVFIQLYGTNGKSRECQLRSRTDNFERGQVDRFKIEAEDVGQINKIRIGHDNSNTAPGWYLDKVAIQTQVGGGLTKASAADSDDEYEEYWFYANRWLAVDEEDGNIVIELSPKDQKGYGNTTRSKTYSVSVHTGDVSGAGTDANVFLILHGETGDSGERPLVTSNNVNKFERNQVDVFSVTVLDMGALRMLTIRHDDSGLGSAWNLASIKVTDTATGNSYRFPCARWLSKNHGDGQICRTLYPDKATRIDSVVETMSIPKDNTPKTKYQITVSTGDRLGAGTDASIHLCIYGHKTDTGTLYLPSRTGGLKHFERRSVDTFLMEAVDVGEIVNITIGHDDSGALSDWYLTKVLITDIGTGKAWQFNCKKWLSRDLDDGLIEREILASTDIITEEDEKQDDNGSETSESYRGSESRCTTPQSHSLPSKQYGSSVKFTVGSPSLGSDGSTVMSAAGFLGEAKANRSSPASSQMSLSSPDDTPRSEVDIEEEETDPEKLERVSALADMVMADVRSSLSDMSPRGSQKPPRTPRFDKEDGDGTDSEVTVSGSEGTVDSRVAAAPQAEIPTFNRRNRGERETAAPAGISREKAESSSAPNEPKTETFSFDITKMKPNQNTGRQQEGRDAIDGQAPSYEGSTLSGQTSRGSDSGSEGKNQFNPLGIEAEAGGPQTGIHDDLAALRKQELMESFGRMRFRSTGATIVSAGSDGQQTTGSSTTTLGESSKSDTTDKNFTYDSDISNQSVGKFHIDEARKRGRIGSSDTIAETRD